MLNENSPDASETPSAFEALCNDPRLGTMFDAELAALTGVSHATVGRARKAREIERFGGTKGEERPASTIIRIPVEDFATHTNAELAAAYGASIESVVRQRSHATAVADRSSPAETEITRRRLIVAVLRSDLTRGQVAAGCEWPITVLGRKLASPDLPAEHRRTLYASDVARILGALGMTRAKLDAIEVAIDGPFLFDGDDYAIARRCAGGTLARNGEATVVTVPDAR